ncbi:MAG: thioredoxin family protein [Alistipes senegalensis]|nr:thioredoxin family protein [Bacteroides cellulosilyticus]MCM1351780.1 thioredoxin family protein [Alistipes senegalensis]
MTDFDKIIWRDALTFVDFFASWCGPCQAMHPVVDRFQEQMRGRVEVYKVNIDSPEMADIIRRYEIRSVPTLMFFRRGEVLWRSSGTMPYDQLVGKLQELEAREHVREESPR